MKSVLENQGSQLRDLISALPHQMIKDLLRVGLLVGNGPEGTSEMRAADPGLSLFMPLLKKFDIRLVPMVREHCPYRFCTGILSDTSAHMDSPDAALQSIPAGGQAETACNAAFGCLGELAERVSLWSLGIRDPRVFLQRKVLPEVDIGQVLGLSDGQSRDMARQLRGGLEHKRIDWNSLSDSRIEVRSLATGTLAQLPSIGILFQDMKFRTGMDFSLASSAGAAVWQDVEGARERALLELAERDAVAQAWYNRLGISSLDLKQVGEILPINLIDFLTDNNRNFRFFSVRTDLDVHIAIAISYDDAGAGAAFGSSAGWNIASACEGAAREMLQSENALQLMEKAFPENGNDKTASRRLPKQLFYARNKIILRDLPIESAPRCNDNDLSKVYSYEKLLQSCIDRHLEIWEFDATRPDLQIPCIKLLSSDLCGWEPRFGKSRLFQGVVEAGLRSKTASEAEFAARPFPF